MPWDPIKLNDGNIMPSLVFGNGRAGNGQASIDQVEQAIAVGFSHIDTAQGYRNETEAGIGIRESGLARDEIFITTKFSGQKDIPTAIRDSLAKLGVAYVDMYIIHNPDVGAVPDLQTTWAQMEVVRREGLAKSIGVSNYNVEQLKTILASGTITPALNQIELHPYVNASEAPIVAFCKEHNIAVEGYSPLEPIRGFPGGPLDAPLDIIAERLKVSPSQVLLAWVKAKGVAPVTASSKRYRLEEYLNAGDIVLTTEDVAALDEAGASWNMRSMIHTAKTVIEKTIMVGDVLEKGRMQTDGGETYSGRTAMWTAKIVIRRVTYAVLGTAAVWGVRQYLGVQA